MSGERVDLTPFDRVRMAVSDCGYDPEMVSEEADDCVIVPWDWPREITWAARLLGFPTLPPVCLACFVEGCRTSDRYLVAIAEDRCVADRLFQRDCGVLS